MNKPLSYVPRKSMMSISLYWRLSIALLLSSCTAIPALDPQTAISNGELSELQAGYDVHHYTLNLDLLPEQKSLRGDVRMRALAVSPISSIELDFDPRFEIVAVEVNGLGTTFTSDGGKLFLSTDGVASGEEFTTRVEYVGQPYVAENPPWEGGFVWSQTESGEHWIATAVQGRGCDLFWPCKDHISDKPDRGVDMRVTVPEDLTVVMNGKLVSESVNEGRKTFHWRTNNPISTYHIALNIAPYKKYELEYTGLSEGAPTIPVVFYHVTDEMEKVERLIRDDFMQQIAFFEKTLGPYPWGEEKIGVVETPHLGMEHQTINAYGNEFEVNDAGFDWLILHEFAHEWWGNLLTQKESRDFWLHEGTASFMDSLYYQERVGAAAYWSHMWEIYNELEICKPIVPDDPATTLDYFDSNDVYYKGAWTLHTLRWLMGEQAFWNTLRRVLYDTTDPWSLDYPITPVRRSTEDFIAIASEEYGSSLDWFFDVYLRSTDLPRLDIERSATGVELNWENYPGFQLEVPVQIVDDGEVGEVVLAADGQVHPLSEDAIVHVDPDNKLFRDFGSRHWCESAADE